jgi:hypothetical protein
VHVKLIVTAPKTTVIGEVCCDFGNHFVLFNVFGIAIFSLYVRHYDAKKSTQRVLFNLQINSNGFS